MNKFFLLLSLLISQSLCCTGGRKSMIRETLSNIDSQMDELKKQLADRKQCQTEELHPICNKGYKYWNSVSEAHYYKGVYRDADNLEGFLDVALDTLPFARSDILAIKGVLLNLEFTDFIEMFIINTIFDKYASSSGAFFNLLFEENCNTSDELDFLISSINTGFKLGDEVFLAEYSSGNIFSGTSGYEVVKEPASLTYDQLDALMQLFEISVYENSFRIVRLLDGL